MYIKYGMNVYVIIFCTSVALLALFKIIRVNCAMIKFRSYVISPGGFINCTKFYKSLYGDRTIVFYKKGKYVSYNIKDRTFTEVHNRLVKKSNKYDIRINIDESYYLQIESSDMNSSANGLNKKMINVITIDFDIYTVKIHEHCIFGHRETANSYNKFYNLLLGDK